MRWCLIHLNVYSQSSIHPVVFAPFSVRKKNLSLSVNWVMKCLSTARRPIRRCNSFLLFRVDVSMTTLIWSGLTSIALWVTINPKNLPALTPKANLARLSFMLYALIKRNVSSKCKACSLLVLFFTTISSM